MSASRRYSASRYGEVLATGLWPGTGEHPRKYECVLLECRACNTEQVTPVVGVMRYHDDWRIECRRDADGEVVIKTHIEHWPQIVRAHCLACGRPLRVRVIGWTFKPWTFGCGISRPLPPGSYEVADAAGEP